ncbi:MAG: hypothetical protein ACSLFE_11960 [Gemmatimonadaceae bacterium]
MSHDPAAAELAEHASRLRQHFTDTFPTGIELVRKEWTVLESWPGTESP